MRSLPAVDPALIELLAGSVAAAGESGPAATVYEEHWQGERLASALRTGDVVRATIRTWAAGRCGSVALADGIECKIEGALSINRAVDGDQVAVHVADGQAKVVAILTRNWRLLAGSLLESDEEST